MTVEKEALIQEYKEKEKKFIELLSRETELRSEIHAIHSKLVLARDISSHAFEQKNRTSKHADAIVLRDADDVRRRLNEELAILRKKLEEGREEFDQLLIETFGGGDRPVTKAARHDKSGKIDIYFGGSNSSGDGLCHGHATLNKRGRIIYLRLPFAPHDEPLINVSEEKAKSRSRTRRATIDVLVPAPKF